MCAPTTLLRASGPGIGAGGAGGGGGRGGAGGEGTGPGGAGGLGGAGGAEQAGKQAALRGSRHQPAVALPGGAPVQAMLAQVVALATPAPELHQDDEPALQFSL